MRWKTHDDRNCVRITYFSLSIAFNKRGSWLRLRLYKKAENSRHFFSLRLTTESEHLLGYSDEISFFFFSWMKNAFFLPHRRTRNMCLVFMLSRISRSSRSCAACHSPINGCVFLFNFPALELHLKFAQFELHTAWPWAAAAREVLSSCAQKKVKSTYLARSEWLLSARNESQTRVRHMIDNVTTDWIGNSSPRNTIFFARKTFKEMRSRTKVCSRQ